MEEINFYVPQLLENIRRKGRMCRWKPISREEFKIFLVLVLHMGFIKLPSLKEYWIINRLFRIQFLYRTEWNYAVFSQLFPDDCLYKIRPIIE